MKIKNTPKWKKVNVLSTQLSLIEKLCQLQDCEFANPSQFVSFVIRKELERKQSK